MGDVDFGSFDLTDNIIRSFFTFPRSGGICLNGFFNDNDRKFLLKTCTREM